MDNNLEQYSTPQYDAISEPSPTHERRLRPRQEYTPIAVIAIIFAFFVVGNIVGSLIMIALAAANGMDFQTIVANINANSPIGTRNFMRATLFLNHFFSFILPAIITAFFVYKKLWFNHLRLSTRPTPLSILMGIGWFLVSMPLVQWVYKLNQKLPLPEWMINLEQSTGHLLEGIIAQDNFYEIIINVLLIGVIPAIGEELMFRGIIQQQIGRLLKNEHLIVWASAAIFSAVHMQFQGFFARLLLGALLGYLFIWTKNLWVPIILHLLNNGVQVLTIYVMGIKPSEINTMTDTNELPLWSGFVSLVVSIVWGIWVYRVLKKDETTVSTDSV
ncbi:MAG: CPBP family intramembrane metalloprotease [Saprospiraceae bacterium]|nr:CPBP family intramembrane metalloprotease [Saprospiraceae bacterium]